MQLTPGARAQGFLAPGTDIRPIVPALEKIWADSLGKGMADFNFRSVTSKFNELVFQYPIRIPERFALVIRCAAAPEHVSQGDRQEMLWLEELLGDQQVQRAGVSSTHPHPGGLCARHLVRAAPRLCILVRLRGRTCHGCEVRERLTLSALLSASRTSSGAHERRRAGACQRGRQAGGVVAERSGRALRPDTRA